MSILSMNRVGPAPIRHSPSVRDTVLLVDDCDANLAVMAAVLRPYYQLVEARDGREALAIASALAQDDAPACVLCDQRMPGMSGVELLAQMRQRLPFAGRIIVTGFVETDTIVDAVNRADIHRLIVKPFDPKDFLGAVHEQVQQALRRRAEHQHHLDLARQNEQQAHALADSQAKLEFAYGLLDRVQQQLLQLQAELAATCARLARPLP